MHLDESVRHGAEGERGRLDLAAEERVDLRPQLAAVGATERILAGEASERAVAVSVSSRWATEPDVEGAPPHNLAHNLAHSLAHSRAALTHAGLTAPWST